MSTRTRRNEEPPTLFPAHRSGNVPRSAHRQKETQKRARKAFTSLAEAVEEAQYGQQRLIHHVTNSPFYQPFYTTPKQAIELDDAVVELTTIMHRTGVECVVLTIEHCSQFGKYSMARR